MKKTLTFDLGELVTTLNKDGAFFGHDKIEGVAAIDGGTTFVISNDSDFGIDGVADAEPPFTLKAKALPNGKQDHGEILIVDTTKLPAKIIERTASVQVESRLVNQRTPRLLVQLRDQLLLDGDELR